MTKASLSDAVITATTAAIELLVSTPDDGEVARRRAWDDVAKQRAEIAVERRTLERERLRIRQEWAALATQKAGGQIHGTPRSSRAPLGESLDLEDGLLVVPSRITYAWCFAFRIALRPVQMQVSRGRRSQFLRIARLSPLLGEELDARGLAFRWIRYVAYGDGYAEQQARYEQLLRGERPKPTKRRQRVDRGPVRR